MNSIQVLLVNAIDMFFYLLEILFLIRIVFSFLRIGPDTALGGIVYRMTEPIIGPMRSMVDRSPLGGGIMLDFSYIFALILLSILRTLLIGLVTMF